jgi:hypothetical protein
VFPDREALELGWDAAGQTGGLLLDKPLDLSGNTLQLRTMIDPATRSVRFGVRLTDVEGRSADLEPVGGSEQVAFDRTEDISRLWAQTVTVNPDSASAAIDLSKIESVELLSQSARGRAWILDVAAVPLNLPSVSAKRIPLVSLGVAKEVEGNDPDARTVRVPFTLNTKARSRSSFVVRVASYDETQRSDLISVQLAPGQTKGSIPIDVVGNTASGLGEFSGFNLTGWAVSGVMTDSYLGQLDLQDDDPLPKLSLNVKKKTVKEGEKAIWVLNLDRPLAKDVWVQVEVLRGPRKVPALTGADLTRKWRREHAVRSGPPLYKQDVWLSGELKAGSTRLRVSLPIAKDGRSEPKEQVTLRFSLFDAGISRTKSVYVAASRT